MKVVELLESRRENWRALERACEMLESRGGKKRPPELITQFASLYRAACADLALADAYQLPPNMVQYLHQLVGRAHNQLYRGTSFQLSAWWREMFFAVPQRLFADNCLRLATAVFWGVFLACMLMAIASPKFTEQLLGKEEIQSLEDMYEHPAGGRHLDASSMMAGFYIFNNAGIGLQCFAFGLIYGIGGLFITISNAAILGAVFGHMANAKQCGNFYQFVTAHGPFELTGIVLAAAAGMRFGFSMIETRGWTRAASLRRAAREAVPAACAAVALFCLAAPIEAFVSHSTLPYAVKAGVAILSSGLLMFYFVLLGYPRGAIRATG